MASDNGGAALKTPEDGIFEEMLTQVPRLREQYLELDDEHDRLKMQYQELVRGIDERRRRIATLLKALGQDTPQAQRRKRAKKKSSASGDVLIPLIDAIKTYGDEDLFTARDLMGKIEMNWSEPHTYAAINKLREIEFIGQAGRTEGPHPSRQFRILDRERGEQLRAQLQAEEEATPSPLTGVPSPRAIRRVIDAIHDMEADRFAALAVKEELGDRSTKHIYEIFRYLTSRGIFEEAGTDPEEGGKHARTMYRIADEAALNELLGIKV